MHQPSQPRLRARQELLNPVEFTMTQRDAAPCAHSADFLDLLFSATSGVFPGPVLKTPIAWLETGT